MKEMSQLYKEKGEKLYLAEEDADTLITRSDV